MLRLEHLQMRHPARAPPEVPDEPILPPLRAPRHVASQRAHIPPRELRRLVDVHRALRVVRGGRQRRDGDREGQAHGPRLWLLAALFLFARPSGVDARAGDPAVRRRDDGRRRHGCLDGLFCVCV